MATASKTSKTTVVQYGPAVDDEQYQALKQGVAAATAGLIAAQDEQIAVEIGNVSDDEIKPYVDQYIRAGALALMQENATRKVQTAERAVRDAQRQLTEGQYRREDNAIRHAELATERLSGLLGRLGDNLGVVTVQPMTSKTVDHAGRRRGSVRITITDSPLSHRTLKSLFEGDAIDGDVRSDGDYTFVWETYTVDPAVVAANDERQRREDLREQARRLHALPPTDWSEEAKRQGSVSA